jgi:TP901 family phage tail tape measure protein
MAGRIKGITIEINGDTTKLDRALADVNKKGRDLNSQLRDINKLLKFNPGNAELLAQKQRVLADSVKNTEERLKALKNAQEQARAAFEKGELSADAYEGLKREIIDTEKQLKSFRAELEKTESKALQIGESLKKTGGKIESAGKSMKKVSAAAGVAGGAMVKMASDFDNAIAKLSTISDASVPIGQLKTEIVELSNETGIAATDIAESVYGAISAGQETGDAVNFVRQSTMLAKAGFADTAATTDVLTTALNAYGLEADKVSEVSDMLIQTQNRGKTTVDELAQVMGRVIPVANGAGVQMNELSTAFVLLTKNGISTAQSSTYLKSMFNELSKTGSKADEAIKAISGKSFPELMKEGKTTAEVLEMLSEYADQSGMTLKDMFGSVEAGTAALTLMKDGVSGYNEELTLMNQSSGATSEALEKLQTPAERMQKAMNRLKNALIEIGEKALPFIEKLADWIGKLAERFSNLSPETQSFIMAITAITAIAAPLLIFIGKLATGIGSLVTFFSAGGAGATLFGGIMSKLPMLLNPTTLAIGAIIAIGVALYKNWDKIKEKAGQLADWIGEKWENIKNWTSEKWGNIKESIGSAWKHTKENTKNALITLGESIFAKWGELDGTTQEKWEAIKQGILAPIEKAKEGVKNALEKMKSFFNFEWKLPKIKLPHFKKVGTGFLGLPKIGVDWYDKGGIFRAPSVIGVGEKRPEFVGALDDLKEIVAEVIDERQGAGGGTGVTVTGNKFIVRKEEDIEDIAEKLYQLMIRKQRGGVPAL